MDGERTEIDDGPRLGRQGEKKTVEQLEREFEEQIQFIQCSCSCYDGGQFIEAKRIALQARILFHDPVRQGMGSSLRRQLIENERDPCTISECMYSTRIGNSVGLVSENGKPVLQELSTLVEFEEWWLNETFTLQPTTNWQHEWTRQELVCTTANQEGGAHIDPKSEEKYYVANAPFAGVFVNTNPPNAETAVFAALRTIGHEILASFERL